MHTIIFLLWRIFNVDIGPRPTWTWDAHPGGFFEGGVDVFKMIGSVLFQKMKIKFIVMAVWGRSLWQDLLNIARTFSYGSLDTCKTRSVNGEYA
jgi:hypothetical protein